MGFIAGPYTSTWNSGALGQAEDGYTLSFQFFRQLLMGDNFAESPQDGVYRGGESFVSWVSMEYNAAGMAAAFWPYSGTVGTIGQVGRLDVASSLAKSLVLTAVAGTPAAAAPASLTGALSILADGHSVDMLFAPRGRTVPLRMRQYPNNSTGVLFALT